MDGKEAYFGLLAQDMLQIAEKYKTDIDEVHKAFYGVSCNREKLIKFLGSEGRIQLWTELEDIALKDGQGVAYNHVLKSRGEFEVDERKRFLEI